MEANIVVINSCSQWASPPGSPPGPLRQLSLIVGPAVLTFPGREWTPFFRPAPYRDLGSHPATFYAPPPALLRTLISYRTNLTRMCHLTGSRIQIIEPPARRFGGSFVGKVPYRFVFICLKLGLGQSVFAVVILPSCRSGDTHIW